MKAGPWIAGAVFLLAGIAGWQWRSRGAAVADKKESQLQATWTGSSFGQVTLPAEITWCPGERLAILLANDSTETGVLLAFRLTDSLVAGEYGIRAPEDSLGPRPWVVASLRHVPDTMPTVIKRYAGLSGEVTLMGKDAQKVAGKFTIRMRWPGGADTVLLRGSFAPTPVVARAVGCPQRD